MHYAIMVYDEADNLHAFTTEQSKKIAQLHGLTSLHQGMRTLYTLTDNRMGEPQNRSGGSAKRK